MPLTIGRAAQAANVNAQTLRYYERRGLLLPVKRTPSGYRQYSEDTVARLRFIKRAQELGFSLKEIQGLLALRVRHGSACDAVERRTRQKIALVERKIEDLRRIRRTLEQLAAACATREATDECPILGALEDHAVVRE
ncbi:MAG: MerR family transcriptional regulator [Gemmatimonadetes bacterium]|nr:MerR family transcriptional regulator [Gemmatimonadota bacterium]